MPQILGDWVQLDKPSSLVTRRPIGLLAIVVYKSALAVLLILTAIALLLTLQYRQELLNFVADNAVETGPNQVMLILLDRLLNFKESTIQLSGLAVGIYAVVTVVEAIGLWYERLWAELLVIGLTCIGIPFELLEIVQGASPLKLLILGLNVAIVAYLWWRFRMTQQNHRSQA